MDFHMLLRLGSAVNVEPNQEEIDYGIEMTTLDDDEVKYIMQRLTELEQKYFAEIPLSRNLKNYKSFIYNIPRPIFELIKQVDEEYYDSTLSPLFVLYSLLVANIGIDSQKIFLEKFGDFIEQDIYGGNKDG
jgi:hypothetical protein